jgi:predicted negative regulator of RcsB-dependent stress response
MVTNATEEQQLAALKEWWKGNGSAIITGVILGLAAMFSTKAWFAWQERIARNASDVFVEMNVALEGGNNQVAAERAGILIADFSNTSYAAFAALALARMRTEENTLDAAATQLQWAVDHGKEDFIRDVARLRLARVKLAQGDADAAQAVLGQAGQSKDALVLYEELRGDIELARGNRVAAQAAYAQALAVMGNEYPGRPLLQLKHDDVAAAGAAGTPAAADVTAGSAQ